MKIQAIAITALSLLIPLVSPVKAEGTKPETKLIQGILVLSASSIFHKDGECFGMDGFRDLQGELPVVVRDGKGEIVAMSKTQKGKPFEREQKICTFDFDVKVPLRDFYTIAIGSRKPVAVSAESLEKKKWMVGISIIGH